MMTDRGTFIIHGTERVVVTQLVRSPGAYIMEPKQAEREKQVLVANLMPQRGSWLELEIDKKGTVNVRIDRKRKFPVTVLLRAMGYGSDEELVAALRRLRLHQEHHRQGHDALAGRGAGRALPQAAPRRAADPRRRHGDAPRPLLRPQALRPLARRPPQAQRAPAQPHQARAAPRRRRARARQRRHHRAHQAAHLAARQARRARGRQGLRRRGRLAAAHAPRGDRPRDRRVRALRQPPPAHRRRARAGRVPHRAGAHGARHPRAPHHRGPRHHRAGDAGQHPPGRRRPQGVLRLLAALAVHGPDQLAVRPHASPAPERPGRRRPHARARAHRGARRAPDALRPHVPHRDP